MKKYFLRHIVLSETAYYRYNYTIETQNYSSFMVHSIKNAGDFVEAL